MNNETIDLDTDSPTQAPHIQLTKSGQIFGTPMYMSPEQSKGIAVDHRSDIYALGLILYECLTGQLPFRENSAVEIMMAHISRKAPPLSHKLKNPPRNIESLINQCLAKSVQDRPKQVSILLKQFDQHQAELDSDIPFELHGSTPSHFETLGQFTDPSDMQDHETSFSVKNRKLNSSYAVSYTHLTLPTTERV